MDSEADDYLTLAITRLGNLVLEIWVLGLSTRVKENEKERIKSFIPFSNSEGMKNVSSQVRKPVINDR